MKRVFLKIVHCKWCRQVFSVCQSCWRGQIYCSDTCRQSSQRMLHRIAQKRYRQTEKGKKAHREAEKRRRIRNYEKTVDDDATTPDIKHDKLPPNLPFSTDCCHFCGKKGVIVDHFPHRIYGGRYEDANITSLSLDGG